PLDPPYDYGYRRNERSCVRRRSASASLSSQQRPNIPPSASMAKPGPPTARVTSPSPPSTGRESCPASSATAPSSAKNVSTLPAGAGSAPGAGLGAGGTSSLRFDGCPSCPGVSSGATGADISPDESPLGSVAASTLLTGEWPTWLDVTMAGSVSAT